MKRQMNNTRFFIMRSETQAIKAKKLLTSHSIAATVYKSTSPDGCSYGIAVPLQGYQSAVSLFNESGIPFTVATSHK